MDGLLPGNVAQPLLDLRDTAKERETTKNKREKGIRTLAVVARAHRAQSLGCSCRDILLGGVECTVLVGWHRGA